MYITNKNVDRLIASINNLSDEVGIYSRQRIAEFEWFKSHNLLATKQDLKEMEKRIMSKISEWFDRVEPKITGIQTSVDELQRLIVEFQNSPGTLSPEDQAKLDAIENAVNALATDAGEIPKPPTT